MDWGAKYLAPPSLKRFMELWVLVVVITFVLIMLRIPIAFALFFPSLIYVIAEGFPIIQLAMRLTRILDSFTMIAVPLFILVGTLMNESGVTDKIFEFANSLIGHFKGGLAYVNIIASLIFAGMSGSALADIGGIGQVLIKSMEDNGYSSGYAAAVTSASSTIGPIFPPSVILIIYGVLAGVSTINLLVAGIVPALIIVVLLFVATFIIARYRDFPTSGQRAPIKEICVLAVQALPALIAPVILVGGILFGIFTPTEVAAVTIVYILVINTIIYDLGTEYIYGAILQATKISTRILFIVATAGLFSWILIRENVSQLIFDLLSGYTSPLILIVIVSVVLLIMGMFLDPLSALIIATPVFAPILEGVGYDPVYVGIIIVYTLMLGLLTPPVGLVLFVANDVSGTPIEEIIKEIIPYYIPLSLSLVLLIIFPGIVIY